MLPFWLFPNYLSLASQIAVAALFALSLDLILGYAGVVSLGHAAFFGIGAYTAGLFSKFVWGEVFTGLIVAAIMAALVGYASSFIIARFRHLTLIMITLGLGLLLHEAANSASWLTGGSDGLQGVSVWKVAGLFKFDLYGTTAYGYALGVLFVVFLVARRLINSPFGLALRGIRENFVRMPAIGADSRAHIRKVYTISAAMAGIAGAVIAQTTQTVSLEALSFERSADVLVMLVLGGAGRLYGGLVGAAIFLIARDQFSGIAPQYWYFWIGILLVVVVMFLPNGILGGLSKILGAMEPQMSAIAPVKPRSRLQTRGLSKALRLADGRHDIALNLPVGARYALIGPNGAGKTTLINLMTGMLAPNAGQIFLGGEDITALTPQARVKRGLARTFQINTLFAGLNALEAVTLAVCERRGIADRFWQNIAVHKEAIEEAYEILVKLKLGDACYQPTRELPYGRQRLLEIALALATKPKVLLLDEPAAGVPQEESRRHFRSGGEPVGRSDAAVHRARHARRVPLRHAHHRAGRRRGLHRRLAGRDRRRSRRARSLSGSAQTWLRPRRFSNCSRSPPAMATPWCCTIFRSNCRSTARSPCSAATASASRRCC